MNANVNPQLTETLAANIAAFIQYNAIDLTKVSLDTVVTAYFQAQEEVYKAIEANPDQVLEIALALDEDDPNCECCDLPPSECKHREDENDWEDTLDIAVCRCSWDSLGLEPDPDCPHCHGKGYC